MKFINAKNSDAQFANGVLHVSKNARVLFVHFSEQSSKIVKLAPGASLEMFSVYLNDAKCENIFVPSENCNIIVRDIFFGNTTVQNKISLKNKECKLSLIAKGVLNTAESANYTAFVSIGKNAFGCEANVEEHAYLLGKDTKANLLPALEILNNNVIARHAATISELDKEQIFYLMSRGLSEAEARGEIVAGFLQRELALIKELFDYEVKL